MGREKPETRRAREAARYANDPEYREKIKAQRKAYYEANRDKVKARTAAHKRANPGGQRAYELKRKYGLTIEDWDALLVAQSGRCAICVDPLEGRICVDHCHETEKVRGLLCSPCNTGIGHLRDSVQILIRAARYLNSARRMV